MSRLYRGFCLLVIVACGCNQTIVEPGPSYADLVVTYNAEIEALDRLEGKREKLIKDFAVATAPTATKESLSNLEGLLQSATELKEGSAEIDTTGDPNELLDKLTDRTAETEKIAGELLQGLLGGGAQEVAPPEPTPEELAAAAEQKKIFDSELATLDQEIAKQKKRVERAKEARDAAESESESAE